MKGLLQTAFIIIASIGFYGSSGSSSVTSVPVIGIMTQPTASTVRELYMEQSYTYVYSSYIKWAQTSGVYVVPLMLDQPLEDLFALMSQLSGAIFPGGTNSIFFDSPSNPKDASSNCTAFAGKLMRLFDYAFQLNKNGSYFPVWATCLSFETLSMYVANSSFVLGTITDQINIGSPLKITDRNSTLFRNLSDYLVDYLANTEATFFDHGKALYQTDFTKFKMDETFKVTATSQNDKGVEFIAMIEHKEFPIFGAQFHIEKAIYTLTNNLPVNHSIEIVQVSQYLINMFGEMARKANKTFDLDKLMALYYDQYKTEFAPYTNEWYYVFPMKYFGEFQSDGSTLPGTFPNSVDQRTGEKLVEE